MCKLEDGQVGEGRGIKMKTGGGVLPHIIIYIAGIREREFLRMLIAISQHFILIILNEKSAGK